MAGLSDGKKFGICFLATASSHFLSPFQVTATFPATAPTRLRRSAVIYHTSHLLHIPADGRMSHFFSIPTIWIHQSALRLSDASQKRGYLRLFSIPLICAVIPSLTFLRFFLNCSFIYYFMHRWLSRSFPAREKPIRSLQCYPLFSLRGSRCLFTLKPFPCQLRTGGFRSLCRS